MSVDHFRGQFLGAGQCGDRFADVLPLCVRSSDVEEKTGLSFRGETGWIYLLCQFKRPQGRQRPRRRESARS